MATVQATPDSTLARLERLIDELGQLHSPDLDALAPPAAHGPCAACGELWPCRGFNETHEAYCQLIHLARLWRARAARGTF